MEAVAGDLQLYEEFLIGIDDPEAIPVDESMRWAGQVHLVAGLGNWFIHHLFWLIFSYFNADCCYGFVSVTAKMD